MITSKKFLAFTASLPLVYLIIGILLNALLLNGNTPDSSFSILLYEHFDIVFPFELITLIIALPLTYVLIEKTRIGTYTNLIRCSPFINIGIGLFLAMNFWIAGILIAFGCAVITAVRLFYQRIK